MLCKKLLPFAGVFADNDQYGAACRPCFARASPFFHGPYFQDVVEPPSEKVVGFD